MSAARKEPAADPVSKRPAARGARIGPKTVFSLSEQETYEFGLTLGRQLEGGERIVLSGDLGTGKTVFVRGVAAGLDIAPQDVGSPSFTLIHEYKGGRFPLFHVDLYRVESDEELATLGLEELLDSDAAIVVEWGERLPPYYRRDALVVRFYDVGEGARRIELEVKPGADARPSGDA